MLPEIKWNKEEFIIISYWFDVRYFIEIIISRETSVETTGFYHSLEKCWKYKLENTSRVGIAVCEKGSSRLGH